MTFAEWQTLILVVAHLVTAVTPILLVLINRKIKQTVVASTAAAETVKEIHIAVNSERATMLDRVEALRNEILSLTTAKAVRDEQDRDRGEKSI